jgi:hypothetical protein
MKINFIKLLYEEENNMKKNKGITLVALVVTIVVLLILSGVSINLVLGNNGIIAKAKDAETKSAEAGQNDLKGMNVLVSEMEGALAGNGSTGSGSGNGGAGGSGAGTKVPAEATAETAPYFPDNTFTKKEGTIDTGLVIQDANGNEYVWVVVPRTTAVYATTGLGKTTFTDADYTSIENDLKEYTKTYRGSTSFITDTWYADDKNEGWLSETEYKTLKNSMLKSVYENGGFYVGRYEAGIGTNRTSIEAQVNGKYPVPTTAPVTKADAYPYTYVTRTQAQNLASNVKSGTKTSSLMFGVQWDLVLAFMHNKGNIEDSTLTSNSTTIGNYYNSTFDLNRGKYAQCGQLGNTWKNFDSALDSIVVSNETTGKMKKTEQNSYKNGILLTTGGTEQSKVMNIYDIAGNVYEWTLEKTPNTYEPCVTRGGLFNDTGSYRPAAEHGGSSSGHSFYSIGFRVSIF